MHALHADHPDDSRGGSVSRRWKRELRRRRIARAHTNGAAVQPWSKCPLLRDHGTTYGQDKL